MGAHAIPLPKEIDIIKLLFASGCGGINSFPKYPENIFWFSLGRWALSAGVRILTPPDQIPTAWIPEYMCREVSKSLLSIGAKVKYYPVNLDLQPNFVWFKENATLTEKGQIFIVAHYFGIKNETWQVEEFCRERGLTLLEDAAHCLPMGSLLAKMRGEAMVFSPHKLLPLPEGGILVLKKDGAGARFGGGFTAKGSLGSEIFWLAKRLGRRWLLRLGLQPRISPKLSMFGFASGGMEAPLPDDCNNLWLRLFRYYWGQTELICTKRRAHYLLWLELISSLDFLTPLFPQIPADCCPQVFPVLVHGNRDLLQEQLRQAGIPAGTWPDLPDEIMAQKSSSAHRIKDHLLTLPVHQDLQEKDLLHIGARLMKN